MFNSFDISVSGLVANRIWMDTVQSNVANMHTTRDEAGRPNPYRRQAPLFAAAEGGAGVEVVEIQQHSQFRLQRDPGHPDAIPTGPNAGMVKMPEIDWPVEMANALIAQRAYEANMTALQVTKQMYMADLRILA